jgi:protein subunit release factor A
MTYSKFDTIETGTAFCRKNGYHALPDRLVVLENKVAALRKRLDIGLVPAPVSQDQEVGTEVRAGAGAASNKLGRE